MKYLKNFEEYGLIVSQDGVIFNAEMKALSVHKDKYGYPKVGHTLPSGKRTTFAIHRLLAMAFIPNPLNKPHVNHIDGNKGNFALNNLEWCTPKENSEHASRNGFYTKFAKRSKPRKIRNDAIVLLYNSGKFEKSEIAEMFGMTTQGIGYAIEHGLKT